jgi:hypothetical protein
VIFTIATDSGYQEQETSTVNKVEENRRMHASPSCDAMLLYAEITKPMIAENAIKKNSG